MLGVPIDIRKPSPLQTAWRTSLPRTLQKQNAPCVEIGSSEEGEGTRASGSLRDLARGPQAAEGGHRADCGSDDAPAPTGHPMETAPRLFPAACLLQTHHFAIVRQRRCCAHFTVTRVREMRTHTWAPFSTHPCEHRPPPADSPGDLPIPGPPLSCPPGQPLRKQNHVYCLKRHRERGGHAQRFRRKEEDTQRQLTDAVKTKTHVPTPQSISSAASP